jgi:putative hydrolase of the HAD superfamily
MDNPGRELRGTRVAHAGRLNAVGRGVLSTAQDGLERHFQRRPVQTDASFPSRRGVPDTVEMTSEGVGALSFHDAEAPTPTAVLWDLGGVLLDMDWTGVAADWEPRFELPAGGLLRCLFGGNDDTVLIGRVPEEKWWEVVRQRLGVSAGDLLALRADLDRRERPDFELLQVVRDLGGRTKQGIVSNAWGGMRERLSAQGINLLFDEIVISAEVGVAKPDTRIFEIALEQLRVPATRCIFIDDTVENVEAASSLGMAGYLHRQPHVTAEWLRATCWQAGRRPRRDLRQRF